MTHIYVGNLTIIGSDNGLSPGRRQAIAWTNVGILLIRPLGTKFSEMLIEIHTFSFKKIHLKMSSGKWRPFCLGLNVLSRGLLDTQHLTAWNTPRCEQNGCQFAGGIFICISLNENYCILISISLKFVQGYPTDINSTLVQVMAWCQTGTKPLPEPMLTNILDVTRPQYTHWNIYNLKPNNTMMYLGHPCYR